MINKKKKKYSHRTKFYNELMKDVLISKSNAFLNWEGERNGGRKEVL